MNKILKLTQHLTLTSQEQIDVCGVEPANKYGLMWLKEHSMQIEQTYTPNNTAPGVLTTEDCHIVVGGNPDQVLRFKTGTPVHRIEEECHAIHICTRVNVTMYVGREMRWPTTTELEP